MKSITGDQKFDPLHWCNADYLDTRVRQYTIESPLYRPFSDISRQWLTVLIPTSASNGQKMLFHHECHFNWLIWWLSLGLQPESNIAASSTLHPTPIAIRPCLRIININAGLARRHLFCRRGRSLRIGTFEAKMASCSVVLVPTSAHPSPAPFLILLEGDEPFEWPKCKYRRCQTAFSDEIHVKINQYCYFVDEMVLS